MNSGESFQSVINYTFKITLKYLTSLQIADLYVRIGSRAIGINLPIEHVRYCTNTRTESSGSASRPDVIKHRVLKYGRDPKLTDLVMHVLMKILTTISLLSTTTLVSAEEITTEQIKGLDEQVQEIKEDVIGIASELSRLEEKLLYPSNTQVSLFVSLGDGDKSSIDAIQLMLDDKVVAKHLYTYRELEALQKGGVQRIYTGNIRTGAHKLVVTVRGKSASGKFKKTATYKLNKQVGPKIVEVQLAGQSVEFRDW
ncbi:MAG: hypothetical protein PVG50_03530 [Thiohalophilus sp.]|jgi:hypothetical protein